MAYEIYLHYHEYNDDGSFKKNENNILKKKLGTIENEYPLEKVCAFITGQLARRDIFVHDVEVFEFIKKKLPLKISKNGLLLKNQKLSYEDLLSDRTIDVVNENLLPSDRTIDVVNENLFPQNQIIEQANITQQVDTKPKKNQFQDLANRKNLVKSSKTIRFVIFSPPLQLDKSKFNYKFTKNKKYPVYAERFSETGIGQILSTIDDGGNSVDVSDEFFVPAGQNLEFSDDLNITKRDGNVDLLNFRGDATDVPVLRK